MSAAILKPFVSEANHWMVEKHGIFQGYYFFEHIGLDANMREQFRGHPQRGKSRAATRYPPLTSTFQLSPFTCMDLADEPAKSASPDGNSDICHSPPGVIYPHQASYISCSNAGSNPIQRRLLYSLWSLQSKRKETLRMLSRLIAVVFLFRAVTAAAEEPEPDSNGRLTFMFAPYVYHYYYDVNHTNIPWLTGLEWQPRGSSLDYGVAFFRNSFSQPSVYAYVGKRWFHRDDEQGFYLELTGGPLYGYRGQYEDKVPYNQNGLALAIIPSIGYQYRAANVQIVILGSAALMLTLGYDILK